jgi:lipopolysaccharide transport system ATP-binding protein
MTRAEIKRKFEEIVCFAEIEKFLDTPVKRYSSGMYVRLAFAVAAHLEPQILVVDEVLAVGDAEFQKKCLGKMHDVSAQHGRTVLFVSHNMGAVQQLCSRAIVLHNGQVSFNGSTEDAVASYLGSILAQCDVQFATDERRPSITAAQVNEDALLVGDLVVDIAFKSPFPLNPPVPGLVVTSNLGVPLFGSNPRFHRQDYSVKRLQQGVIRVEVRSLPLAPGNYRLSLWLGDWQTDYDQKPDALSFNFKPEAGHVSRPNSETIGHLDWPARWHIL